MNETDSLIEKIRKLLILADPGRGGTEAEMLAASSKAAALMAKHNIDQSRVVSAQGHGFKIRVDGEHVEIPWDVAKPEVKIMGGVISDCFDVTILRLKSQGGGTRLTVIGPEADRKCAAHALEFLHKAFDESHRLDRQKNAGSNRRSFALGFFMGFAKAYKQGRKSAVEEAGKDSASTALVEADLEARTNRIRLANQIWIKTQFNKPLRKAPSLRKTSIDPRSYQAGFIKGEQTQLFDAIGR